jgi:hypothetical protein
MKFAPWHDDAACRDAAPALFFPEVGGTATKAKAICAGCPVREQCLDDAIERNEEHGVWGGMTPEERRTFRRDGGLFRRGRRPQPIVHGTRNGEIQHRRRGEVPCDPCREARAIYENQRRRNRIDAERERRSA